MGWDVNKIQCYTVSRQVRDVQSVLAASLKEVRVVSSKDFASERKHINAILIFLVDLKK